MAAALAAALVAAMVVVSMPEMIAGAETQHVVGGDRGWDRASNISDWSSGRVFRVGDKIWFSYSAAEEGVVEVKSREEYEECDVRKPLKLLKNGLDIVLLEEEGIRFFTSRSWNNCKEGLKIDVAVLPSQIMEEEEKKKRLKETAMAAQGPAPPSGASSVALPFPLFLSISFLLLLPLFFFPTSSVFS